MNWRSIEIPIRQPFTKKLIRIQIKSLDKKIMEF